MKNNNEFIELYTKIPPKKDIRTFIMGTTVSADVFNYCVLYLYNSLSCPPIPNFILTFLKHIMICFSLFSAIFFIFPIKMNKLTYLYTAIAFTGTSIFDFYIASQVFLNELDSPISYLIIIICILIYILIFAAVIINIKNKMKKGYVKNKPNIPFAKTFSALCISVGIILAKQTELKDIPFAITLLVVSYILIPTYSGFHKFYLIVKKKLN